MSKCPWRVATGVICIRKDGHILMGRRNEPRRSFGGYWTFPGGTVSEVECQKALYPKSDETTWVRHGALRELGEEAGIWMTADPSLGEAIQKARAGYSTPLERVLFDCDVLEPVLTTLSKDRSGRGLAIQYFVLRDIDLPAEDATTCDELEGVQFYSPHDLVMSWEQGSMLYPPSVATVLDCVLGQVIDADSGCLWKELAEYPFHRWSERYVAKGWNYFPYLSPTLPPETTTNCVWLGDRDFYIVDPAPVEAFERERLLHMAQTRIQAGNKCLGILLTHGHQDHIGAAHWLKGHLDVPIFGTRETEDIFGLQLDDYLKEGDVLQLADGSWEVLETPGHCHGHICFYESRRSVLIAGDMVATESSILVEPHFGDIRQYLQSMQRLIELGPRVVVPAHGLPIADGAERLKEQLQHRQSRIQQVQRLLEERKMTADQVVAEDLIDGVYGQEVLPHMRSFAAASIQAMLNHLS